MKKEFIIYVPTDEKREKLIEKLTEIGYKHTKKLLYYFDQQTSYPILVQIRDGLAPMFSVSSGEVVSPFESLMEKTPDVFQDKLIVL